MLLMNDKSEFTVRLYRDVLLETLLYGDRCRLTKLEQVGRLLHWIIESFHQRMPFLRISLTIDPLDGIFIYGLSFWRKTKVTLSELTTLPPFLRFDEVSVCLRGALSIEEKCEFIGSKLLPLKSALVDSNVVKFYAIISGNRNHFSDHSQFLEFVQTRLLSNCGSSRSYKFEIYFKSDEQLATSAIASLLKMNEIKRSSRIKIEIEMFHRGDKHLPVEEISNWLENPSDGMENIAQIKKERFLEVDFDISCTIQNAREMVDHLKEKFVEAKSPVYPRPFTFRFGYCDVEGSDIKARSFAYNKAGEGMLVKVMGNSGIKIKRYRIKNKY